MRKTLLTLALALLATAGATAQSKVEKYVVTDNDDNKVTYALPITKLYVEVNLTESLFTPGKHATYAGKYLGVQAGLTPLHTYGIQSLRMGTYGIANPDVRYTVKFKSNSVATFLHLTDDGVICAINADYPDKIELPTPSHTEYPADVETGQVSSMSEEYIQATTPSKQAEISAREIFRLRETRLAVVGGESEHSFTDGEALKVAIANLDKQEQALTQRFIGSTKTRTHTLVLKDFDPAKEGRSIAFRFSEDLGLLDKDDLRGAPVYLDVKVLNKAPELTEKEAQKKEKSLKGIVYYLPGKVSITLSYEGKTLLSGEFTVAQLGIKEAFHPNIFTTKKGRASVVFNPDSGSVRRVNEAGSQQDGKDDDKEEE